MDSKSRISSGEKISSSSSFNLKMGGELKLSSIHDINTLLHPESKTKKKSSPDTTMGRFSQMMYDEDGNDAAPPSSSSSTISSHDRRKVCHVLLFGCLWCYPSYATLCHAHDMFAGLKTDKAIQEEFGGQVQLHLIDEEEERDYCDQHDIMVGSSVLIVMSGSGGHHLLFKRADWPLNDRLIGPFNKDALKEIIRTAVGAIKAGKKNASVTVS
mmetsp:Transcript_30732/g.60153  ORF Transcript_30732/g.60153 Transcript_30732/m.60153 type:complete len:213 (-) Transcript_30732:187-825(-)